MKQLSREKHEAYLSACLPILQNAAKYHGLITYEDLMVRMGGPGRGYIGGILEAVSVNEHAQGRPLLSSIVVHSEDGDPGPGYWELPMLERPALPSERKRLVKEEQERVWSYWGSR